LLSRSLAREALWAGDTLSNWPHFFAPLDCWETYTTLVEGLVAVKAERLAALAAHDHARAAALLPEIIDLTYLVGELATSLALARERFLRAGRPWPLAPLAAVS
jgi:hypothetical protein